MPTGLELIAIAVAIAGLISGLNDGVELAKKLRAKWREHRASRGLEKLQQALEKAKSMVQGAYDGPYQRYGEKFCLGDDLARYILFPLAARQETLLRSLHRLNSSTSPIPINIQPLLASIDHTITTAISCLADLAARTQQPQSPQLAPKVKHDLQITHQNLCPSAIQYRTGAADHSALATISIAEDRSSCNDCEATIVATKIRVDIPNADASSCAWMNLSGLFRSHCRASDGWTCIWRLRAASCYGIFGDRKALLKHMLAVHVRHYGDGGDVEVDWPADSDVRRGDVQKCGYAVRIDGITMVKRDGMLVVPRSRQRTIEGTSVPGQGFLMSGAINRTQFVDESMSIRTRASERAATVFEPGWLSIRR